MPLGFKHSEESKRRMSLQRKGNNYCKGRKLSQATKEKIRQANLGSNNHNYGKKFSEEHRRKISEAHKRLVAAGTHHLWQGGISQINDRIRQSLEYKLWREAVFRRDDFKCVFCGNGGYLQADHIMPFAMFERVRFDLLNGRTLCLDCHKSTSTYGLNILHAT